MHRRLSLNFKLLHRCVLLLLHGLRVLLPVVLQVVVMMLVLVLVLRGAAVSVCGTTAACRACDCCCCFVRACSTVRAATRRGCGSQSASGASTCVREAVVEAPHLFRWRCCRQHQRQRQRLHNNKKKLAYGWQLLRLRLVQLVLRSMTGRYVEQHNQLSFRCCCCSTT